MRFIDPDLSLRDVPIAEAAAKAGFDCGNWTKLKSLIDAVRAVNAPVTYPDRWTGKTHHIRGTSLVDTLCQLNLSFRSVSFLRVSSSF